MPTDNLPARAAPAPTPSASRPGPRPKRRGFSRPELHVKVTLHSTHAQRVAGRNMMEVARALYTIAVILQIIGDQDAADQVDEIVIGKIRAASSKLQVSLAQLKKQRTESGIDQFPVYNNPLRVTLHISSPQLSQYASLIQGLDALSMEADTLWLGGMLTNRQHANLAYLWRRDLLELADEITRIERMARTSAIGAGAAEEIAAGEEDAKDVITVEDGGDLGLGDHEDEDVEDEVRVAA